MPIAPAHNPPYIAAMRMFQKVLGGTPLVAGAKVVAEIVAAEFKGPKVYSLSFRRRKDSRKKTGHRQKYVQVRITKIVA